VRPIIEKKPQARLDLIQHFIYIGQDNLNAAERFLTAVEEALEKLAEMPGMGRRREFKKPELAGIRSWVVKGFENYIVFYRQIEGGIEVLRVLHGARDVERVLEEGEG
jgi:toxin ParE1/3/4